MLAWCLLVDIEQVAFLWSYEVMRMGRVLACLLLVLAVASIIRLYVNCSHMYIENDCKSSCSLPVSVTPVAVQFGHVQERGCLWGTGPRVALHFLDVSCHCEHASSFQQRSVDQVRQMGLATTWSY